MNADNFLRPKCIRGICFLIYAVYLLISLQFARESYSMMIQPKDATYYTVSSCVDNSDCYDSCGRLPDLFPLCDRNGTCVCDCHNMTTVAAYPQPPGCIGILSFGKDKCTEYCSNIYKRPQGKICKHGDKVFCTALCKFY